MSERPLASAPLPTDALIDAVAAAARALTGEDPIVAVQGVRTTGEGATRVRLTVEAELAEAPQPVTTPMPVPAPRSADPEASPYSWDTELFVPRPRAGPERAS